MRDIWAWYLPGVFGCAFAIYLIPVLLGFGWSALYPMTPQMVGAPVAASRPASGPLSIEHFGTGVIEVGLSARIKDFVSHGVLPLWNPRQGLGQPFAAMGEGDPFWPPRVVRALVPYSEEIFVALAVCALSGLAMFGLLRVLNASITASTLAAALWITNGSLSMHLARPNLFDQVAMLPVLFFGIAFLMRKRSPWSFALAAMLTGSFAIAGFPQIAAVGLISGAAFAVANSFRSTDNHVGRSQFIAVASVAMILGVGLAAFYLFPLTENVLTGWEPRTAQHGFLPMPYSNLVSFFFPVLAGQPLRNWMPGGYPDITDWNNLYGQSSTLCLYLLCIGLANLRQFSPQCRIAFLFFSIFGLSFYLKYVSLPPFSLFNYIPLVGTITPKHVNGLTAFLLVVASGLVLDILHVANLKRANGLFVGVCLCGGLILAIGIAKVDGSGPYEVGLALVSIVLTLLLIMASVAAVWLAARIPSGSSPPACAFILAVIVAEGLTYVLLGNSSAEFVLLRGALAVAVLGTGWAIGSGRIRLGAVGVLVSVLGYGAVVALPAIGLPARVDLAKPAAYMTFLKSGDVDQYRTFGINADYSGVGRMNDISVAGPFAPASFRHFVETVSDSKTNEFHKSSAKFYFDKQYISIGSFPVDQYLSMRPLFDWLGVKYIVLEKKFLLKSREVDYRKIVAALPTVYDDSVVTVVQSPTARPKAEFFSKIVAIGNGAETELLKGNPSLVEKEALVSTETGITPQDGGPPMSVSITLDTPNEIRTVFTAPSKGILVVKQAFSPGWQAWLGDDPTPVVAVAGMVQGIAIPKGGDYRLTLRYRTIGFRSGVIVSILSLLLIGVIAGALPWLRTRRNAI